MSRLTGRSALSCAALPTKGLPRDGGLCSHGDMRKTTFVVIAFAVGATRVGVAATIAVGPTDSYQKIEAAQAGDEVVIAPGTYAFRVHLTKVGTASQPIVIRAQDPARPPVWDLGSVLVENAPGSYTAGDRGRGCWQISGGAYYQISGIVFANCHNAGDNSAGMRYYNGARGIRLRDCGFRGSDNGLTGGTQSSEITVENSEFDGNGTLAASSSAPSHNIYIYGGSFTLRFSYVHDPVQAQNFHIRATTAVIEYNWFARAKSYEGDLMTDDDLSGTSAVRQTMLLRGNVLLQSASPNNNSQVIAVYNDGAVTGLSFSIRLVNNTFVGNGGHAALVHLSNADTTVMRAELVNNIVAGTSVVTLVEDAANASISGNNNWIVSGASASGLTASVAGAAPGFVNAAGNNFTLATSSPALGKAAATTDLPTLEYYRDEQVARQSRTRASANDLGAFESTTTSDPIGPYGIPIDAGVDAMTAVDTGSAGTGGASGSGGASGKGGASGVDASGVGGGSGAGGATVQPDASIGATGGAPGAGGVKGTGGGTSAGGAPGTGGVAGVGGAGGTGGLTATAGASGTGGARATGGTSGAGGAGGTTRSNTSKSSGCSCALANRAPPGGWWLLGLLVPLALRRRSRRG